MNLYVFFYSIPFKCGSPYWYILGTSWGIRINIAIRSFSTVSFKPLTSYRYDTKSLKMVCTLLDDLWKYIHIFFLYIFNQIMFVFTMTTNIVGGARKRYFRFFWIIPMSAVRPFPISLLYKHWTCISYDKYKYCLIVVMILLQL